MQNANWQLANANAEWQLILIMPIPKQLPFFAFILQLTAT
jgi:hypothetical protein